MLGIPGETLSDFKETIKVNRAIMPDVMFINILWAYPGTDIYKISKEMGLLPHKADQRREFSRPNLILNEFSKKQIQKEYQWFYFNVYRGFKPMYILLGSVAMHKMLSNPLLYRVYYNIDNHQFFRQLKGIIKRTLQFR